MSKFKENDRIVCIDIVSDFYNKLTYLSTDKVYVVKRDSFINFSVGFEVVPIHDDRGVICNYRASRFLSVSEYRSNTINEILE